ncbi:MAG: FAD-dependent oxidoreductase [Deltaproteobacteria bacterium]|nr:FAD-dependent oxidoreductase [Deltaproteobacteria bacterium]
MGRGKARPPRDLSRTLAIIAAALAVAPAVAGCSVRQEPSSSTQPSSAPDPAESQGDVGSPYGNPDSGHPEDSGRGEDASVSAPVAIDATTSLPPGIGDANADTPVPPAHDDAGTQRDDAESPPIPSDLYDLVIFGAGTGGSGAAIQAARLGLRVALVEETDWVGGQATAAGVTSMDGFAGGNLPLAASIYREWIERITARYASLGKSVGTCYWDSATYCFEPKVGQDSRMFLAHTPPGLQSR